MTRRRSPRTIHRLMMRLSLVGTSYPVITLILGGILLAVCASVAYLRLKVSTDQNQLFSSNVGFFKNYLDFVEKFPENESAYVVIEAADPARRPALKDWTSAADAMSAALRAHPELVHRVDERVPIDELGSQAMLFQDPKQLPQTLKEAQQLVPLARLMGERPAGLASLVLSGPPISRFLAGLLSPQAPTDERTRGFVAALAGGWEQTLSGTQSPVTFGQQVPDLAAIGADDPQSLGYYYVPDESDPTHQNHLLLINVYPVENWEGLHSITEVISRIRTVMDATAKQHPMFKIGLTGRPALDADEMTTTDRDGRLSEIVALTAVFIGLVVMLRSFWMALAAELSLAVAIGWTFGWATVSRGELNLLSTVFLIALIGIGMDYLVQILIRYRHESARHARPMVTWSAVFRYVGPPINTACLGAASAFLVSIFTDFRGAADLGIIAGGGLLLCLLAGYTVLPALLTLLPPKRPAPLPHYEHAEAGKGPGIGSLWSPALWVALLAVGVPFMLKAHFDPNLLNLQAPDLESVKLVNKLQTWSGVVLSKDLGVLRKVRDSLQGLPEVARTDSVLDAIDNQRTMSSAAGSIGTINWAPPGDFTSGDLNAFANRTRLLADRYDRAASTEPATAPTSAPATAASTANESVQTMLRHVSELIDKASPATRETMALRLTRWQVLFIEQLQRLTAQLHPGPPDLSKVPAGLREHYVSSGGEYALYIQPTQNLWKQENLDRFEPAVEQRVASVPNSPPVTGITSDIYHSTASIRHSFLLATGLALGMIVLLVLLDLRRMGQTLMAISVLGLGLPMLVALMGLFGVAWNFANFFGLPILIGAGHEYGVFMVHRYREALNDHRRVWRGWDTSDRALLLCAYVTFTSFGFFWLIAHHRGLKSLGLVMALGTGCIYLSATFVLRPLLRWRLGPLASSGEPVESHPDEPLA